MNNTTSTNTIDLVCFIIPNCPHAMGEIDSDLGFLRAGRIERCNYLGIPIRNIDDELLIEVWIAGLDKNVSEEGNDNLSAHGFGEYYAEKLGITSRHEDGRKRTAPSYIPYEVLKDVKEGDVKTFTAPNGCNVRMHFEQLPYRYRRFGTFETVLADVVAVWKKYQQTA